MLLKRVERFFIYRVLSLDDTPHRIALGVAIGIFVAWTPSIPAQMVSVIALSWLLRANKLVGLPFVWITNPVTILPIYGPNLLLGQWILGKPVGNFSALYGAMHFGGGPIETAQIWWSAIAPILVELWVGSLIVATILGVMTYFTMYRIIVVWRRRRHLKHPELYADKDETSDGEKPAAETLTANASDPDNPDSPQDIPETVSDTAESPR
jgi:hypothetical protein